MQQDCFYTALDVLPQRLRGICAGVDENTAVNVWEIRLRERQPLCLTVLGKQLFVQPDGSLTESVENAVIVTRTEIADCCRSACEYSVYSYQNQINKGYITLPSGNRIGICGKAVCDDGRVENVRAITSMNIRIARQHIGCADRIVRLLLKNGLCNTLLVGAPSTGKTTMLRDIARAFSDSLYRVCVIDERGELAGAHFDTGRCTDIMRDYPKAFGLRQAVRSLSPQLIVFDELADNDELSACADCMNAGVIIIASVHADDVNQLKKRITGSHIIESGLFDCFIELGQGAEIGAVKGVYKRSELLA